MRLATFVGTLWLAFIGALAPGIARAQDAGTCDPACGAGEICVGGTCMVPACRPPCGAGETCVGGTCMVPAAPPRQEAAPPPVAPPPPAPAPAPPPPPPIRPVARPTAPAAAPIVRKGAFVIPQVGVSAFMEEGARFLSPGLRVSGLAGGHLTNAISLGGSLTFDLMNWNLPAGDDGSGFMLEAALAPLVHLGDSRAEFIIGPAIGAWMRSVSFTDHLGTSFSGSSQGWALGGNVGLLAPVWKVRLGGIFNLMFRDTLHACGSRTGAASMCSGSGPTHSVIGFAIAAIF